MTEKEKKNLLLANIIVDNASIQATFKDAPILDTISDTKTISSALNIINNININNFEKIPYELIESYADLLTHLKTASMNFLKKPSNKNFQFTLTNAAKKINEFANDPSFQAHLQLINSTNKYSISESVQKAVDEVKKNHPYLGSKKVFELSKQDQQLEAIDKRLKTLEQEQKPLNELHIKADQEKKELAKKIDEIKQSIEHLQSSDAQIEITKILTQSKSLFDEAKDSKQLVNDEVKKLMQAKEGQVAYTLSEQFSVKCENLKNEVGNNLKSLTIALSLFLFWNAFLFFGFYSKLFEIEYWQFIIFKITLNIPFAFFLVITFNEYTKAKRLYEEYEHKRIMAATLVNNLERLKNELHADEKDLLELIKVPFEKIFDNPVHSIYGDKSGDKNIGLDQLEKITSIIEKMKK